MSEKIISLSKFSKKTGLSVWLTSKPEAPFETLGSNLVGLKGICVSEEANDCVIVSVRVPDEKNTIADLYAQTIQVPCRVEWLKVDVKDELDVVARACWKRIIEKSFVAESSVPLAPDDCPRLRAPVDDTVFVIQADGYVIGTSVDSQMASEDVMDIVDGWFRVALAVL